MIDDLGKFSGEWNGHNTKLLKDNYQDGSLSVVLILDGADNVILTRESMIGCLRADEAVVDTIAHPGIDAWLEENKIAVPTQIVVTYDDGSVELPVMRFAVSKLHDMGY